MSTRTSLTYGQKKAILSELQNTNKNELCVKYKCSRSTINRIIREKDSLAVKCNSGNIRRKRNRCSNSSEIDRAVTIWFNQMRASGVVISGNMVKEKATQLSIKMNKNFNATTGWLWRWQKRNGISVKYLHGESASANVEGANDFFKMLPDLIKNYSNENIFNADESGLLFKALPNSTLSMHNDRPKGYKSSKERLTVCFLCNASGDYKKAFVIGKPKNPRCFKNVTLPVHYFSQSKAWMTQDIWTSILTSFDNEMTLQKRKVILFVDNAAPHKLVPLQNVDLQYLPANTTSILQPLDQGIIHALKAYYRQIIVRKQILSVESGRSIEEFKKSINLLTAIQMIHRAWWLVKPETISNNFKKVWPSLFFYTIFIFYLFIHSANFSPKIPRSWKATTNWIRKT